MMLFFTVKNALKNDSFNGLFKAYLIFSSLCKAASVMKFLLDLQ
jgi:hypothetical protein